MALDPYVEAHRSDVVTETAWLVEIRFPTVHRLCDWKDPIVYGGNTFERAVLTVEGISSDASGVAAGSSSLRIGCGDDYWPTLLAALAEDERHPEVVLYEAWFDPAVVSSAPAAVRAVRIYRLETASWTPLEATITLGPGSDVKTGRLPSREYGSGLCTYCRFKGQQCGYPGAATTCGGGTAPERTYEACVALSNQARFGGQRAMPGEEVEITWEWNVANQFYDTATIRLTRRAE